MTVTLTSPVYGQAPETEFTGNAALEDWLVYHGYAERAGTAPGTTGATDVTPDKDPTLAVNREAPGAAYALSGGFVVVDLTAISPTSGPAAGGTRVTITGDHLSDVTAVSIGGVAATNVAIVDDQKIRATTGPHAAGAVNVVVTDVKGSDTLTGAYTYT